MITHPLIYCDWLEEQGKDVTLLREDLECYAQNKHRLIVTGVEFAHKIGFLHGDGCGYGIVYGFVNGDGNGCGFQKIKLDEDNNEDYSNYPGIYIG